MNNCILAPSLLSADFSDLKSAIEKIEGVKDAIVHIDVMDGAFVPQISYGQPVIKSLRPLTDRIFDVHLMVEKPELMVDSFIEAGSDWITFHLESTVHADRLVHHIQEKGKKCGIAICPSTPVSMLEQLLPIVDLVLVMTVNPGFGGQKLIPSSLEKVSELKKICAENGYKALISVDGGVNNETLSSVLESGADIAVSGSAFFSGKLNWK